MSTVPSGSSVAVWLAWGCSMLPVAVQNPTGEDGAWELGVASVVGVASGVGVESGVPTVGPHSRPNPTMSTMTIAAVARLTGSM